MICFELISVQGQNKISFLFKAVAEVDKSKVFLDNFPSHSSPGTRSPSQQVPSNPGKFAPSLVATHPLPATPRDPVSSSFVLQTWWTLMCDSALMIFVETTYRHHKFPTTALLARLFLKVSGGHSSVHTHMVLDSSGQK